ncbi:MAG: hypothetical protein ABJM58_04085 [Alteripontixanthobacter sp.]
MRRATGLILGISLAIAALTAGIGEQLAKARVAAAADFPLNQAASARRFLDGGANALSPARSGRLAVDAFEAAPLSGEAAVALSDAAYAKGDTGRGLAILRAAGALGWHGELVHRVSYIRALERQDYQTAATSAEALLRRGRAREQLAADFAEAGGNPAFRTAIVSALSEDAPWAEGLLAEQGGQMPSDMLRDIFRARSDAGNAVPRSVAAPVVAKLAIDGRFAQGAQLARLMSGWQSGRLIPGWPSAEAEELPTPYEWRLFEGYTPLPAADGNGFHLSRVDIPASRPAQLLMALEPGRYRLGIEGASAATLDLWRYGYRCGLSTQRPVTRLAASQVLVVPPGCDTQVLSLAAASRAAGGDGLPEPTLRKIG